MTTRACLQDMRWFLVLALAACRSSAPVVAVSHQAAAPAKPAAPPFHDLLDGGDVNLVELPALPRKRGLDRTEEATCRAHYVHVERGQVNETDVQRLARVALQVGGDCRIDTDALFETQAPLRVGGCMGSSITDAIVGWRRVAAVASTPARRAAALRNVAALEWRNASYERRVASWIVAGDAHVAAAASDPNDHALSSFAVDAYENALRIPIVHHAKIERAQVIQIANRLARVTDGAAGDRARALRARLRW